MKSIFSAAILICGCCIVCAILNIASPNSKMQKTARIVLSVFFICCLLSPIKTMIEGIKDIFNNTTASNSEQVSAAFNYNELVVNQTAQNLVDSLNLILKNDNINADNIEINLMVDENNCIKIIGVYIYIDKVSPMDVIVINKAVLENLGTTPEIIAGESYG